jgi:ubiquinone/menaquinone biosynthesis C-methylase UbiE
LQDLNHKSSLTIININAGFDETSTSIQSRFSNARLIVFDFYDPKKHTEVSIKRARQAYPPYPNTISITTTEIPLENKSADAVLLILSAHEIRNEKERTIFLKELNRILKQNGSIYVMEHLRDIPNFLVYNIGFFHFHSRSTWLRSFSQADLTVQKEIKTTPFITTFALHKNGTPP